MAPLLVRAVWPGFVRMSVCARAGIARYFRGSGRNGSLERATPWTKPRPERTKVVLCLVFSSASSSLLPTATAPLSHTCLPSQRPD